MDEYEFLETEEKKNGEGAIPANKGQEKMGGHRVQGMGVQNGDSALRRALEQPPLKRLKVDQYQDAATDTDPDSLGSCEPGTAISLEGIVWNETKGGLLSLNLTWRGKSFVGTLLDCAETDHGSTWTTPWHAETQPPDQRPIKSRNNVKKSKKRKKKGKKIEKDAHKEESEETIEVDMDEEDDEYQTLMKKRIPEEKPVFECFKKPCSKIFNSESALSYHTSYAHEKINREKEVFVSSFPPAPCSTNESQYSDLTRVSDSNTSHSKTTSNSSSDCENSSEPTNPLQDHLKFSNNMNKETEPLLAVPLNIRPDTGLVDQKKQTPTPFPSPTRIVPVVQGQEDPMTGLALKSIQPKPAANLCLDNMINMSCKPSPRGVYVIKSPNWGGGQDSLPQVGTKTKCQGKQIPFQPTVIDLSHGPPSPDPSSGGPAPGSPQYFRMLEAYGFPPFPQPVPPGMDSTQHLHLLATDQTYRESYERSRQGKAREFKAQIDTDNKEKDSKAASGVTQVTQQLRQGLKTATTPSTHIDKSGSPTISVRPEFKTGHLRDLKENNVSERPKETSISQSANSHIINSLFQNGGLPPGYLGLPTLMSSHGLAPSLMMPPINSNPMMGLNMIGLGPATNMSPGQVQNFGSSLANLTRTAMSFKAETEERARTKMHSGGTVPPLGSPQPNVIPQIPPSPGQGGPASDSGLGSPLLRHEHTHTHLHLGFNITSPTHNT